MHENIVVVSVECDPHKVIAVEDEPNKIIEITSTRGGRDVLVYQNNQFLGVAKKINFAQSIKASLEGDTITVVAAVTQSTADFIVDQVILDQGFFQLPVTPLNPSLVRLIPQGGVEQINGVDFKVESNKVTFRDMGLDGFLELTEKIIIIY